MIKYNKKIDRAINSKTGRFVKFSFARRSSIFRTQYEPIMLKRKIKELEKEKISTQKIIKELKERGVPEKEWQIVIPEAKRLSPLMMYTELNKYMSKRAYNKMVDSIQEERYGKRRKTLENYYTKLKTKLNGKRE